MKRGGHTPSEPGRAAGRQNLRPYGALTRAFNALRSRPLTPTLSPQAGRGGRHQNSLAPRERGEGRGEGPCGGLVFAAVLVLMMSVASPVMARVPVILDFGDSLTAGYGLPAGQAFAARLEAWLHDRGIAARVVNAGVSGDTTAGGLARLDWALADKPDFVILALGANDALRGIDPPAVRDNLDKIIAKIRASGAKVLLLGMLAPPNWGDEYKREFDGIFP